MPISESIFILVVGALIWFWLDSLKARETGIRAVRQACADEGLQLLDETVAGRFRGLARDGDGRLRLRRIFDFEYSDNGDNRRRGSISLLGQEVEVLHLRPQLYVIPGPHETLH